MQQTTVENEPVSRCHKAHLQLCTHSPGHCNPPCHFPLLGHHTKNITQPSYNRNKTSAIASSTRSPPAGPHTTSSQALSLRAWYDRPQNLVPRCATPNRSQHHTGQQSSFRSPRTASTKKPLQHNVCPNTYASVLLSDPIPVGAARLVSIYSARNESTTGPYGTFPYQKPVQYNRTASAPISANITKNNRDIPCAGTYERNKLQATHRLTEALVKRHRNHGCGMWHVPCLLQCGTRARLKSAAGTQYVICTGTASASSKISRRSVLHTQTHMHLNPDLLEPSIPNQHANKQHLNPGLLVIQMGGPSELPTTRHPRSCAVTR